MKKRQIIEMLIQCKSIAEVISTLSEKDKAIYEMLKNGKTYKEIENTLDVFPADITFIKKYLIELPSSITNSTAEKPSSITISDPEKHDNSAVSPEISLDVAPQIIKKGTGFKGARRQREEEHQLREQNIKYIIE
ncbi:MAG: hypothetical protein V4506_06560 [Bacteroidota bacterium]